MNYKEALSIIKSNDLTDEVKDEVVEILNKKIKLKYIITFLVLVIVFLVSLFTFMFKGGNFTEFKHKTIFIVAVLAITILLTFFYRYLHLRHNNTIDYYKTLFKVYDFGFYVIRILSIFLLFYLFIFKTTIVSQSSMFPTLEDKDRVIVYQGINKYDVGNIVVINTNLIEGLNDDYFVKRIVAKSGETISLEEIGDKVYLFKVGNYQETINEESKTYITVSKVILNYGDKIPEGMFFLVGDNYTNSTDSRSFGLVSEDALVGKVVFRVFPFEKVGVIK